jgi:GTP-binding protein
VSLPLVVIVGAPNVGKSTLFNRIVGRRRAIVTNEPGVTRDRLYGEVRDAPMAFALVDTGGLTPGVGAPFAKGIAEQAEAALSAANAILLVIDARAGATTVDRDLATMLRRRGTPILLVANKIDTEGHLELTHDLHELGLGDPWPVSAEHGRGIEELLQSLADSMEGFEAVEADAPSAATRVTQVAIVGRPNVGKSSLLNRLLGEERVLVSEIPGTTRDAIDTLLEFGERRYRLIDTAGIRRRGKVQLRVEHYSVARARQNIERCDVALLVIDASEGLAAQDAHVAGYIDDAYKPMVVVVNKWDLVDDREAQAKHWEDTVRRRLKFAKQAPMLLVSALTGQRVVKILDYVDRLYAAAGIRVSTPELNRWLQQAAGPFLAPPARGRAARFYYITQKGTHPPHFVLFCNDPGRVHFSRKRQLENSLRRRFGFEGAPVRLELRARRERGR